MSLRIIVIAQDRRTFDRWCKKWHENPNDRRFIIVSDWHTLQGHRYSEGRPYGLLLLNGWQHKAREVAVWSDDGKKIIQWVPNALMGALLELFAPWKWPEIITQHAVIEEV